MLKDDENMVKIRKRLLDEAAGEARKQRDLKRFGNKVQEAKLQEREREEGDVGEGQGFEEEYVPFPLTFITGWMIIDGGVHVERQGVELEQPLRQICLM